MTNKEIKQKYQAAFSHSVPDVFEAVLEECALPQVEKTVVVPMFSRKKPMWRKMISVAAAIAIVLTSGAVGFSLSKIDFVDSIISFDVNPSIEIEVNQKEQVIAACARNQDGEKVLNGMNLKGSDLTVAVNAIVGSMLRNGYIDELSNSILISVENQSSKKGQELEERISEEIDRLLQAYAIDGAVISQTLNNQKQVEEMAEKYGITRGKAQLILQITNANKNYTFKDLAPLTINELVLLTSSNDKLKETVKVKGKASEKKYIGKANAKKKALLHDKVSQEEISNYFCELDYSDGKMVYKIGFITGEAKYDYVINAVDGKIIKAEIERKLSQTDPPITDEPQDLPVIIDEASVKALALNSAGVSEGDIQNFVCVFNETAEVPYYNISFFVGETEYIYNINARTGEQMPVQSENTDQSELDSSNTESDQTQSDVAVSTPTDSSDFGGSQETPQSE